MLILFVITKLGPEAESDVGTAFCITESNASSISGVLIQVPDTPREKTVTIDIADVGIVDSLGIFDGIVVG